MEQEVYVVAYICHDPIGNTEWYVSDFDKSKLREAEAAGCLIIEEFSDGSRKVTTADEVDEPPATLVDGIKLVAPKYVDDRTNATVAVFDALAAIIDPESAVATADETGEAAEVADPLQAFKDALDALKALEPKKEANVD